MATLQQIQTAFLPLQKLSHCERTFTLEGVSYTLRRINTTEEAEVMRCLSGSSDTPGDVMQNQDDYRHTLLGYAIVEINGIDLRQAEIDTGERTAEGRAITQPKMQAVRQIVSNLSRDLTVALMARYGEMSEQDEIRLRRATAWSPLELDQEIAFFESRIEELKQQQAQQTLQAQQANPVLQTLQQGVRYFQEPRAPEMPDPTGQPEDEPGSFTEAPEPSIQIPGLRQRP